MRKSIIYLLALIIMIVIASCSKDEDILCDCTVVTFENINYNISECAPEGYFDGTTTLKQLRVRERNDNCQ